MKVSFGNHVRTGMFAFCVATLFGVHALLVPDKVAAAPQGSTLRVDVDLVTIEVIAQDKKGSPMLGLKKENFKVYEDGKQQEVMSFDAVTDKSDEPMPTSLKDIDDSNRRGKVVLILFDDSNITASQIQMSREAAEKYVKQHMRPWDFFGVASYGLSLKILQNLTHDADMVVAAIRQPAMSHAETNRFGQGTLREDQNRGGVAGPRGQTNRQDPFGRNPVLDPQAKFRSTVLLRTLGQLSSSMSRVKGRKSVLLFSEDFSLASDAQVELRNTIQAAQKANVAFYSIDARGLNSLGGANQGSLVPAEIPVRSAFRQSSSGSWLGAFARRLLPAAELLNPDSSSLRPAAFLQAQGGQAGGGQAGGGGQTGGAGGQTGGTTGGTQGGGAQGGQTGGTGNTGVGNNTGGRNPNDVTGRGQQDQFGDQNRFEQFQQQAMMENILRSLASETGGLPIFNTNNLNQGLDKVDLELSNYYLLGFSSTNPKRDGKFRKLEVRTDVKGLKLKHRNGYLDPRPPDALAGSKGERSLMSAISSPTPITQLPVSFRPVFFYDSPQLARVPISARIQRGTIELKKKGGLMVNAVDVMGVAYAEDGSVAARFSETLNLAVEKEREELFRNSDIPYRNYIKLRPGKYQLKLAIADEKGKVGTSEQTLAVPPMPTGLASSSLVVSQEMAQLPDLIKNMQTRLLDEPDPLIYKGIQILPPVGNIVRRESPIAVFYKLYNLEGNQASRSLTANVQIIDEKGQVSEIPAMDLEEAAYPTGPSEVAIGFNLPLKDLPPGKYQLKVETVDKAKNQSITSQTEMVVQ